jgi:hypothetical protein
MRTIVLLSLLTATAIAAEPATTIKVDQAGYLPHMPKVALVAAQAPAA